MGADLQRTAAATPGLARTNFAMADRPYREMYKALIRRLTQLTRLDHDEQISELARVAAAPAGLWNDLEPDPLSRKR